MSKNFGWALCGSRIATPAIRRLGGGVESGWKLPLPVASASAVVAADEKSYRLSVIGIG